MKSMKSQRRQGKVIDELGFVRAIAKIGDVIHMWDVGFGNQLNVGSHFIQNSPDKLNYMMGLREMNAGSADFLPKIGNGIEANKSGATLNIHQEDVEDFEQHFRAFVIEIDLVFAERRPKLFVA